jgi:hypothetical protein
MVGGPAVGLPLSVTSAAAAAPAVPVAAIAAAVVRLPVATAAALSFVPVAGTPGSFPVGCRRRRCRRGKCNLLDEVERHPWRRCAHWGGLGHSPIQTLSYAPSSPLLYIT